MNVDLNGKVALVTGGSRGIGAACCLMLAEHGAAVAVHYRSHAEQAAAIVSQIQGTGGRAMAVQAELTEPDAAAQVVASTVEQFGSVDILVNNAGAMTDAMVADMSDEVWEHSLNLNLSASFRCVRACIPHMQGRNWGRIVNMTSQAAYRGSRKHAHYAAAKAGLSGLTAALALELAPYITVNLVAPGRIATDMLADTSRMADWMKQTPLKRLGLAEEVAGPVVFLSSEAASYITGATLHVNGGLYMG